MSGFGGPSKRLHVYCLQTTYVNVYACSLFSNKLYGIPQTLSTTVADMMKLHQEMTVNYEMQETERFVRKADAFFDCLNVRDTDTRHRKRKPNLLPYTKPTDPRFKVSMQACRYLYCLQDFIQYTCASYAHRNSATS